jgi:hypothetical protein
MAYFKIEYSCGCGTTEEHIIANSIEEAEREAYERAIEDYHSFEGFHGVRSMEQIAEEMFGDPWSGDDYDLDTLTEEELAEVEEEYNEAIENEISYSAVEITEEEYLEEV